MRRYESRFTLMTSNRPIEGWGKLPSDVPAASAILDRLFHHAEVVPITGRSYRFQYSVNQRVSSSLQHQHINRQISDLIRRLGERFPKTLPLKGTISSLRLKIAAP